ncbi:unnamed protein product [Effrenium voratum]|uniref:J domain-containing protein n=1 Tax=Effrenium voratum TaxID=2562239 RepID=A0AA36NCN9_9DINO|nr:unnamed protein product [Effrenium voratum]CAJ1445932.1 unnamed protein product [Effrenium voratum]
MRKPLPDYYAALEIHEDSDELTIKKAYRRLVLQWHPDRNPSDREAAEEKIRLLNIAYETVTNPLKRETYDLQRAASKKRKGPLKPRSAPRVGVPKEFMMQPVGHPESFVRSLGRRVVVHSRGDAPDANFQSFFLGSKFALWWLPEVNNMCRIRSLGSKARGDKRAAAAGRAGGLNMAFDPHKAKTAGAAGGEVRMAPANKGQKADSVNFVTKASPICEGALRFESASQRGQYLAFIPPSHLRVVPFLEETEDRVLDFLFVDFASMFKFITLQEVLEPIFSSEAPGTWIELSKLQDDEAVKSHFKEVMGKEVWDAEDFQAYFEGHWATFEYKPQEKVARLRPRHERLAKRLRATPKAEEVVAAVSQSAEGDLQNLPIGALARALTALAKASEDAAHAQTADESTAAQIRLLAALRAVKLKGEESTDIPAFELLHSAEKVQELGGDNPDDTVLVQRTAAARILASKAAHAANKEGGMIEAGFTLPDVLRFLLLPGTAGRDMLLATACVPLFEGRRLPEQREVLRTAKERNSTNLAAAAGTAVLKTLSRGGGPTDHVAATDDHVETVKEVAQCGVRLPAAAALLRRMAATAKPLKLAEALMSLAQRCGPGQAEDLQAIAETLASKGFGDFSPELLLEIVLASSKNEVLEALVLPAASAAANILSKWSFEDMVKLLLALARRKSLFSPEVAAALRGAAEKCLTAEQLQLLCPHDLAGMALAALGHGWVELQEATSQELLRRLPHFPAKDLLTVTPVLLQAQPSKLIGAWPKVLSASEQPAKDAKAAAKAKSEALSADQLVQLARLTSQVPETTAKRDAFLEDLAERLLPKVHELSAAGRARLSAELKSQGLGATAKKVALQKSLSAGVIQQPPTSQSEGQPASQKRALTPTGPTGQLSKKQRGTQFRNKKRTR